MDAGCQVWHHARIRGEVDDATAYAEAAPYPDPATAARHVYFEGEGA